MSTDVVRPGSVRAWLLAARPKTLTAAWAPVVVGTACAIAAGGARWGVALAALLGASLIQIGTNFANDVFDFEKGADDEDRLGPTRAVQAGLISVRAMRIGTAMAFLGATAAGVVLVAVGGWPIVVIGLLSILSGLAYTGGPYPLGYNGLGDVFVFVFFGLVAVCTTTWLQVGKVTDASVLAAVAMGALATAVLVVNNVRDVDTDVRVGKRTLAVRHGRRFAHVEYAVMMTLALAAPVVLVTGLGFGWPVLLPLATAPLAVVLTRRLFLARDGASHNILLGQTAGLLLVHGVLLSAGLVLGAP